MELCTGGTLTAYLASLAADDRRVPESDVWRIVQDVASGLDVLHRHDIVHLDVKPDNVFVTASGQFKVGDFGMATPVTTAPSRRLTDLEGDGAYMAKELLARRERLPSADMFCLGITLLEIVTGMTLPTAGDEWHALRSGALPAFPPEYSVELTALIAALMHADAAARPSAASVLALARVRDARASGPSTLLLAVRPACLESSGT